jgi:hypothetical protein
MAQFWTNPSTSPKRAFRFTCTIGALGEENTWLVTTVKKPNITVSEVSHKYLNHTFWYPGRVEWDTCSVTLVDPISPNAAGLTARLIENSGYVLPGNGTITDSITKNKAVKAMGNVIIRQFTNDVDGSETSTNPTTGFVSGVVEEWTLVNPFITSVDYGELSYESEDLTNVTLTIRYDYATLFTPGSKTAHPSGEPGMHGGDGGDFFVPKS